MNFSQLKVSLLRNSGEIPRKGSTFILMSKVLPSRVYVKFALFYPCFYPYAVSAYAVSIPTDIEQKKSASKFYISEKKPHAKPTFPNHIKNALTKIRIEYFILPSKTSVLLENA